MQDNMGALTGSRTSTKPASGHGPTGFDRARNWQDALKHVFNAPGVLESLAKGVRRGASPVIEGRLVSWSDWLGNHMAAAMGDGPALDARTVRLVRAAREVAFGGHFDGCDDNSRAALKELDAASERFAGDVPWEGEPDAAIAQDTTPVDAKKKD